MDGAGGGCVFGLGLGLRPGAGVAVGWRHNIWVDGEGFVGLVARVCGSVVCMLVDCLVTVNCI
jgi:hypothetical protein